MNIHILRDDKFYDGMTKTIVESGLIDNNLYFVFDSRQGEFKIMDPYPNCIFGGEEELNKINLADYDKAIFHSLHNPIRVRYLAKAGKKKGKCKVYWRLWTGDNYGMIRLANVMRNPVYINHSRLYDDDKDIRTIPAVIVNSLRNIRARFRYRGRYRDNISALSHIDYAMNWNELEIDVLKEVYPTFKPKKYMNHGYIARETYSRQAYDHVSTKKDNEVWICVGNSGFERNNHVKIFNIIKDIAKTQTKTKYKVICPLSYGIESYIKYVIEEGHKLLGEMFCPLMDFMEYTKYMNLLQTCDVFVFGQQIPTAAGNVFSAISMGKKIVIPKTNLMYGIIENMGAKVFDLNDLKSRNADLLSPLSKQDEESNMNAWSERQKLIKPLQDSTLMEIIN